jgi:hypothetical protein
MANRKNTPLRQAMVRAEDAYGCVSELTHSPTLLYPMTAAQFARSMRRLAEAELALRELRRAMDRVELAA